MVGRTAVGRVHADERLRRRVRGHELPLSHGEVHVLVLLVPVRVVHGPVRDRKNIENLMNLSFIETS